MEPPRTAMFKRVLLVDDSEADLLYGRIVLERAGVAEAIVTFEDAREALAYLATPAAVQAELILLDLNMPGMDGFAFLEAYSAQIAVGSLSSAQVVVLSSSPDPQDQRRASAFGCVRDYLIKPLQLDAAQQLARLQRQRSL